MPRGHQPDIPGTDTTFRLLERLRAGDQTALGALYARYLGPLRRWATGRLPRHARDLSDTDDLVQETLVQTFRRIESFEPRRAGALQAYLRQALMNRIRDELRRVGRRGPHTADADLRDANPSPLEQAIGKQATERYEAAMSRLRPEDREAIIARLEMGCSYEEMAEAMGKPSPDAARKAAQRAVFRLATEMKRAERGSKID
jgi:RNA polymerase sigma factor (sigma-70 family)